MEAVKNIIINKNRGWRGLAEATIYSDDGDALANMIFSFSQDVWDDMQRGYMVFADKNNYWVIEFDPHTLPHEQRSVLIKNFNSGVVNVYKYDKETWRTNCTTRHFNYIRHFKNNANNHTTSKWNYVGIRVIPNI